MYADWLTEHGNPRGEFIRVQCELARSAEGDPRRFLLEKRERELLELHEDEWRGPFQQRQQYPAVAQFPIDVKERRIGRRFAVPQDIPPPGVLFRLVDPDVVGHDVDDQTQASRPRRGGQPC